MAGGDDLTRQQRRARERVSSELAWRASLSTQSPPMVRSDGNAFDVVGAQGDGWVWRRNDGPIISQFLLIPAPVKTNHHPFSPCNRIIAHWFHLDRTNYQRRKASSQSTRTHAVVRMVACCVKGTWE